MATEATEYKLFCFNNAYLMGIHNGIQAGHASVELMRDYYHNSDIASKKFCELVEEWADNHKTYAILNAGDSEEMIGVEEIIRNCGFPWAKFYEPGMNNLLTSICVVLPDYIYDAKKRLANADLSLPVNPVAFNTLTNYQKSLAYFIPRCPAAR